MQLQQPNNPLHGITLKKLSPTFSYTLAGNASGK